MHKCRVATGLCLLAVFFATGEAQTLVDLRTQSKSVDFSAAGSTKPMQTGSSDAIQLRGRTVLLPDDGAGGEQRICLQSG